jgi:hypothetical protein
VGIKEIKSDTLSASPLTWQSVTKPDELRSNKRVNRPNAMTEPLGGQISNGV